MRVTNCKDCGQIILTKILEASIPALCPVCGPAYSAARIVSNTPNISPQLQNIAVLVCGGLLAWAGYKLLDDMFS